MKVIEPYYEIMYMPDPDFILTHLEKVARTCYKSEEKITHTSAKTFLKGLLKSGHLAMVEHLCITVKLICDRGISHEVVRHRLCAFAQESTRYANYSKNKFGNEITVIRPFFFEDDPVKMMKWENAMKATEKAYLDLIHLGASAQEARSVLPNSLKTEVVVSTNPREWRHIFGLRCDKAAHPQIRQVMIPLLQEFNEKIPVLFEDLWDNTSDAQKEKYCKENISKT